MLEQKAASSDLSLWGTPQARRCPSQLSKRRADVW